MSHNRDEINYCGRAHGALDAGNPRKAIEWATLGITSSPDNELWYGPQKIELYRVRSIAYQNLENYDAAIEDASTVISLAPELASEFPEDDDLGKAYSWRGNLYRSAGDYKKAIEDYSSAITVSPKDFSHYMDRGIAYKMQGLKFEAIQDFRKALTLVGENYLFTSLIQSFLADLE